MVHTLINQSCPVIENKKISLSLIISSVLIIQQLVYSFLVITNILTVNIFCMYVKKKYKILGGGHIVILGVILGVTPSNH